MILKTSNTYSLDLKLRVVKAYNEYKYTISKLAEMFNVSKSSIYNWIKQNNNDSLTNKKDYIKITSIFRNEKIRNIITTHIEKYPNFNKDVLMKQIFNKTKIELKKSTLYNIIDDLNFSKKLAKFQKVYGNPEKIIEKTNILKTKIKTIPNENIISIDEISYDTNIIHKYAWSKKGKQLIKEIGATYKRLTMICAITNEKIIHYTIINNSANSDIFLNFIKTIPNIKDKFLFLDNACIHHSKIVSSYATNNNIKFLFNVPYSPQYNPIELMFSKLKKNVRDKTNNNNLKNLKINIIKSLKTITKNNLINFFKHAFNKLRL